MEDKALWNVKDVAHYLGVPVNKARLYMREKNCPTLNKSKNQHLYVPRDAFIEWVRNGMD